MPVKIARNIAEEPIFIGKNKRKWQKPLPNHTVFLYDVNC